MPLGSTHIHDLSYVKKELPAGKGRKPPLHHSNAFPHPWPF